MGYITTRDHTELYVKDWGAGRPVILIHGWPLSSDTWDEVAMAIAGCGMRAIAYDRRGFGRSSQPYDGYNYDTLADDLADVIQATDAYDVSLVGFSMGGGEVARYLSRHGGQRIQSATLISSIVPGLLKSDDNPHGVEPSVFDEMAAGIRKDRAYFLAGFFESFYGEGMMDHPVSDEGLEWSRHIAMQASLKATLDCATAFATTDFLPELESFRVPTLIIHGTDDETVPIDATGRRAAEQIEGARLIEYRDAPHGVLVTHKDRLIGDLLEFLVSSDAAVRTAEDTENAELH